MTSWMKKLLKLDSVSMATSTKENVAAYTVCYMDITHQRREFVTYATDAYDARSQAVECIEDVMHNPNRIIYIIREKQPHNF